jgi:hypothetical protein
MSSWLIQAIRQTCCGVTVIDARCGPQMFCLAVQLHGLPGGSRPRGSAVSEVTGRRSCGDAAAQRTAGRAQQLRAADRKILRVLGGAAGKSLRSCNGQFCCPAANLHAWCTKMTTSESTAPTEGTTTAFCVQSTNPDLTLTPTLNLTVHPDPAILLAVG